MKVLSLKSKVTDIYVELKSVRSMINAENVRKIDLPVFKIKLQSLWKNIEEFKNLQDTINTLAEEQKSINDDLSTLTRVIRKHKNFASTDHFLCKATSSNRQSQKDDSAKECDYDEAEDFCTLLAKTGHTGSWSEEDHLLFVNLRKRHHSVASLVVAIQAKCPDLTKESIVNHEAWYKTYLDLREKQKLAVQEWRDRKQSERQAKLAAKAEEPTPSICKIAEHKKVEIERKKELVRRWKEQREKQRVAEEERLKSQLRARREMRENQRRARAERLKHLVEEYKRKKAVQEEGVASGDEREQAMVNALNLRFYRARDQEFVEKRRSALSSKKTEPKPVVDSHFNRVREYSESTLLKETKAWQEKLKRSESQAFQTVSYIKDLPTRTLVSWKSYEIPGAFTSRQR
ncbi:coiled-coil domain-containing protein 112 isoform X2 [Nasonia vitripennis]|uniref:Coiled-coil domain-containing protein 112 n=1 Tax=Nasonia vitripennis TaxID=7425 RepID=A0A7M7H7D1_NASVI|nr:coiled-coil domain-containing protein 112 isoform X2 [Nasonia vitripennis]